jgi:HAD superfamily phosphoserine phosphatase-like hydrolase
MHIILFDMDKTLVNIDTVDAWLKFLFRHGYLSNEQLRLTEKFNADYVAGILDVNASYKFIIELMKSIANKISLNKLVEFRHDFFEQCVLEHISDKGMKLIQEYRHKPDHLIVLITATIDFIAQPVFNFLSLDYLIATDTNIHDEANKIPLMYGIASIGVGKLEKYHIWKEQHNINAYSSILYSDSINDLPLMSHVDIAIAVDPDPMLHKIATYNNWQIISLRNDLSQ